LEQPTLNRPGRRGRLRRGIYILPSIFTVGTLLCGYFAILSTFRAIELQTAGISAGLALIAFDNAAKAIGWAILFDGMDGRIARLTNSTSEFGREFDSLADVITFGVAPALLAFAWGVRALDVTYGAEAVKHLRQIGWVVSFAYVICGAARLARFNIDSGKGTQDRRFFIGLPIPAAAGVVAAIVHWTKNPLDEWIHGAVGLGLMAILAYLMVSRVRYYSFKAVNLRQRRPYVAIIALGLIVWLIAAYSEPVLFTLALTYLLSGPLSRIISRWRPQPPAPKEVHAA
jgi:CDP-diacylglycerol---serine O-phosphatidyltransferase